MRQGRPAPGTAARKVEMRALCRTIGSEGPGRGTLHQRVETLKVELGLRVRSNLNSAGAEVSEKMT